VSESLDWLRFGYVGKSPRMVGLDGHFDRTSQHIRVLNPTAVHGRPRLPSFQFVMGSEVSIAPVHPDFRCSRAAVPDGICWSGPIRFVALEVLRTFWALPTTV